MTSNLRPLVAFGVFLSLALGCSNNSNTPATISGTVTYKDQKVTAGTVTFYGNDGVGYPANIRPDGTYVGTDLPIGEMKVTIETESAKGRTKPQAYGGRGKDSKVVSPMPEGFKAVAQGEYVKIPPKYADKTKSPLTHTVHSGSNTKDFALED